MSNSDPIKTEVRKSRAARRVGIGAKCQCGEDRPRALIPGTNPIICAECERGAKGQSTFDQHHPTGRANSDMTVAIPANDHRAVLSEDQREWPEETLRNPDGSPLLAAAARIRGFIDMIRYLMDKLLTRIPPLLEALDAFLVTLLGPHWWTDLGFAEWWKKGNLI